MRFNTLDELIEFDNSVTWHKEEEINLSDYKFERGVQSKYNCLKGEKQIGVYNNKIVAVVSDKFQVIKVSEIAEACDKAFGNKYEEKSFKEGIVRIYDAGKEDKTGKVSPLSVFPANRGNLAVKIGLYHNASVCDNGMIVYDSKIGFRIIHRGDIKLPTTEIKNLSKKMGYVLAKVDYAQEKSIGRGVQLAMIVQGLSKKDNLIKKALIKYPEDDKLWSTIQTITEIATHKTKNGFIHSKKAGNYLINEGLDPVQVVDAANYVFKKKKTGKINFEVDTPLYITAVQELKSMTL
jgi:hypothetical protein